MTNKAVMFVVFLSFIVVFSSLFFSFSSAQELDAVVVGENDTNGTVLTDDSELSPEELVVVAEEDEVLEEDEPVVVVVDATTADDKSSEQDVAIPIDSCQVISLSGTYVFAQHILADNVDTCIEIIADDVELQLASYSVQGARVAISVLDSIGVSIVGDEGARIADVDVGIVVDQSKNVDVSFLSFESFETAVIVQDSDNVSFSLLDVPDGRDAFFFEDSSDVSVLDSVIAVSGQVLETTAVDGFVATDNVVSSTKNIGDAGSISDSEEIVFENNVFSALGTADLFQIESVRELFFRANEVLGASGSGVLITIENSQDIELENNFVHNKGVFEAMIFSGGDGVISGNTFESGGGFSAEFGRMVKAQIVENTFIATQFSSINDFSDPTLNTWVDNVFSSDENVDVLADATFNGLKKPLGISSVVAVVGDDAKEVLGTLPAAIRERLVVSNNDHSESASVDISALPIEVNE